MPWKSFSHHHSMQTDRIKYVQHNQTNGESSTMVFYIRSSKTYHYQSRFLKLLDGIAFVGGIVEAVFGFFIFMAIFGRIFF